MRSRSALAISVGVHAAAIAVLLWLSHDSEQPPEPALTWTEIELLDELPVGGGVPDSTEPAPAAASPDPSAVTPVPQPDVAPPAARPDRRRKPATRPGAQTDDPTAPLTPNNAGAGEPATDPPPSAGGVALLGLRGGAMASATIGAPRLPAGSVVAPRRPGAAVDVMSESVDAGEIRTPADAGFVRGRSGRLVFRDPDPEARWSAELLDDGRIRFSDRLGGSVPERLMAARGIRFWLKRKQRLLTATRTMRLNMAVDFAEKNIDRQLSRLYRDLLAIWESNRPPRTRRRLLFEVWDDCEESLVVSLGGFTESEPTKIDAMRRAAGLRARRTIIAFVARHVPAGSTDAYPKAELAKLNDRRVSRDRFAPYAGA